MKEEVCILGEGFCSKKLGRQSFYVTVQAPSAPNHFTVDKLYLENIKFHNIAKNTPNLSDFFNLDK